jgi:hypothetical protein
MAKDEQDLQMKLFITYSLFDDTAKSSYRMGNELERMQRTAVVCSPWALHWHSWKDEGKPQRTSEQPISGPGLEPKTS